MITLSIGMPRAGSGWFFNLTNDLLVASGFQDARYIRKRYHLQRVLTEVNCNIGAFTLPRLAAVMVPSLLGNTFTVKAHAGPTNTALSLIRRGMLLPTYIYRDPRDAMLSAREYGQRGLEKGRANTFSHLNDFDAALNFMLDYVHTGESWMACQEAFQCRYEDLLVNYNFEVDRLINFLKLDITGMSTLDVVNNYRPETAPTSQKGLHFSQGKIGRFRQEMTSEQQEIMSSVFGPYLDRMGYQE
ncbi:sulfotransferase domain-containing protein [Chloroflexota bacterium]